MTDQAPSRSFVRALQTLMPAARITILHERPWHSLTFSGAQICLSVALPITGAEQRSALAQLLEHHEFVTEPAGCRHRHNRDRDIRRPIPTDNRRALTGGLAHAKRLLSGAFGLTHKI